MYAGVLFLLSYSICRLLFQILLNSNWEILWEFILEKCFYFSLEFRWNCALSFALSAGILISIQTCTFTFVASNCCLLVLLKLLIRSLDTWICYLDWLLYLLWNLHLFYQITLDRWFEHLRLRFNLWLSLFRVISILEGVQSFNSSALGLDIWFLICV